MLTNFSTIMFKTYDKHVTFPTLLAQPHILNLFSINKIPTYSQFSNYSLFSSSISFSSFSNHSGWWMDPKIIWWYLKLARSDPSAHFGEKKNYSGVRTFLLHSSISFFNVSHRKEARLLMIKVLLPALLFL